MYKRWNAYRFNQISIHLHTDQVHLTNKACNSHDQYVLKQENQDHKKQKMSKSIQAIFKSSAISLEAMLW